MSKDLELSDNNTLMLQLFSEIKTMHEKDRRIMEKIADDWLEQCQEKMGISPREIMLALITAVSVITEKVPGMREMLRDIRRKYAEDTED